MIRPYGDVSLVGKVGTTPSSFAAVCKTRCNRPSVSVLDISPPQERNGPPLRFA